MFRRAENLYIVALTECKIKELNTLDVKSALK